MLGTLSLKSIPWRTLLGLLLAGVLGWGVAWLSLPGASEESGDTSRVRAQRPEAGAPSTPEPQARSTPVAPDSKSNPATLEQLLQRQSQSSQAAASSLPSGPAAHVPSGTTSTSPAVQAAEREAAQRAARRRTLLELQSKTLAELQAVPPGDTKTMMAVMTKFDAQMQAAGAPSIIDLDKLRQSLMAADQMQQLNKQLVAEAEKGRNADPARVKALSAELQASQKSISQQFIKADVLQKQLSP